MRYSLLLLLFISIKLFAQIPACNKSSNLIDPIYQFRVDPKQEYTSIVNFQGRSENHTMDIYYPTDDGDQPRPVVILAHGGFFLFGSKEQMTRECIYLAQRGYVAATINYTKWQDLSIPDSNQFASVVIRAVNDMKTAVRYFRHSASELGNPYQIDPNAITIGGYSAGSFMGLHASILQPEDEPAKFINDTINKLGGYEGVGEYPSFSHDANAIINISGALYRSRWVDNGMPPMLSMHGDEDETVPYGRGFIRNPITNENIILVEGSFNIDLDMQRNNYVGSEFITVEGGDHNYPWITLGLLDSTETWITEWLQGRYCPSALAIEESFTSGLSLYPNPAKDRIHFNFNLSTDEVVEIYSTEGKLIRSTFYQPSGVDISDLVSGNYIVKARNQKLQFVKF